MTPRCLWIPLCSFLSTLSLRRATAFRSPRIALMVDFYPRSPCGERQMPAYGSGDYERFLSTLSLRRATRHLHCDGGDKSYFYPRSPCGERRSAGTTATSAETFLSTLSLRRATVCPPVGSLVLFISIHALLAESDKDTTARQQIADISIHALLAESDSKSAQNSGALLRI